MRRDTDDYWTLAAAILLVLLVTLAVWLAVESIIIQRANARDLTGRYAQSDLQTWFETRQNRNHQDCCLKADGRLIENSDVDVRDGHYIVRLFGKDNVIPDDALVDGPNKAGPPIVWIYPNGSQTIRCFMPGAGA